MRQLLSLALATSLTSLAVLALGCSSAEEPSDGSTDEANATAAAVTESSAACQAGETTIFTCKTKTNKILSVCASADLGPRTGYIQYRFGTSRAVELELPEDPARRSFRQVTTYFETDPASSGSRYYGDIAFKKDQYTYAVYSHVGRGAEGAGVRVTKEGQEIADIECSGDYREVDLAPVRAAGVQASDL